MINLSDLPERAGAAIELSEELADVMGDDLVAVWLHGGTTFEDRPAVPGDLDVTAVFARVTRDERDPALWKTDPGSRPARVVAAEQAVTKKWHVDLDTSYFLLDEARRPGLCAYAFRRDRLCTAWAIERAHWLAGRYTVLFGRSPEMLVQAPTPAELAHALDRELEHIERHVYEGDAADPYEATYAVWTGCRILYALSTGSPVISKRSAGNWAIDHLPPEWHPAIHAAGRSYDGRGSSKDEALLRSNMGPFVKMVREYLPPTEPRPPGPPRWS